MKTLIATLLALTLMCLALPALAGGVDETNPLFKEATAKEQRNLDNEKEHVFSRLNELVKDGAVNPEKMKKLRLAVKLYRDDVAKAKAVYGNLIVETLNPKVDQVVDWYYAPLLRNGARHQTEIKKNLAELTGVNIGYVEEEFSFGSFLTFLMMICALGILIPGLDRLGYRQTSSICCIALLFIIIAFIGAIFGG